MILSGGAFPLSAGLALPPLIEDVVHLLVRQGGKESSLVLPFSFAFPAHESSDPPHWLSGPRTPAGLGLAIAPEEVLK